MVSAIGDTQWTQAVQGASFNMQYHYPFEALYAAGYQSHQTVVIKVHNFVFPWHQNSQPN